MRLNQILLTLLFGLTLLVAGEVCYYFLVVSKPSLSKSTPVPTPYVFDRGKMKQATTAFSGMLKKLNLCVLSNDKAMVDSKMEIHMKGKIKSISTKDGYVTIHFMEEQGDPSYAGMQFEEKLTTVEDRNGNKLPLTTLASGDTIDFYGTYTYTSANCVVKILKDAP